MGSGRRTLCLLFGGRSCEHEVSVTSARSVLGAVDPAKFEVVLIAIDKAGGWHLVESIDAAAPEGVVDPGQGVEVLLDYNHGGRLVAAGGAGGSLPVLDVVFPVLHGPFGEDGTLQGLLELADIPYVGAGVAASAVGMDKELAKRIFATAGLDQAPWTATTGSEWRGDREGVLDRVSGMLSFPLFVKPANLGSSVGISKAQDRDGLAAAIAEAARYDEKVVIEQSLEECHEVECAVLGNESPAASVVGEIIPGAEFYDYHTKYIDDRSELLIPARIPEAAAETVRTHALRAFRAIGCTGLGRVDFFVGRDDGRVWINEINTMPGFTPISMYPKLWGESGLSYPELVDRLIALAFERHVSRQALCRVT